jgi:folate-binding protein YgfZ
MFYAALDDRAVIALSGEDTIPFLQGLITNDAALLQNNQPLYSALLSPQGKFLHDFFLLPQPERILLDVSRTREADLLSRLKIYRLRSKVTIEQQPQIKVVALWGSNIQSDNHIMPDPRLPAMGYRAYGDAPTLSAISGKEADYEHHRIALGIPDGAKDMHIDKSLLLEFGFENLHGVNFSKGCYVGQEVTARSKFRGQVRKQLYQVWSSDMPLPACGTPITADGMVIGELRSTSANIGLALLRSEEVEKAAVLMVGDTTLNCRIPNWNRMD